MTGYGAAWLDIATCVQEAVGTKAGMGVDLDSSLGTQVGLVSELQKGANGGNIPGEEALKRWGFEEEQVQKWRDEWKLPRRRDVGGVFERFLGW